MVGICFLIILGFVAPSHATAIKIDNVTVVNVSGSHYEMGIDYGKSLQKELNETLQILFDYFFDPKWHVISTINTTIAIIL